MIWDEGLRTTLHSVQRYIVSGSFPAKRASRRGVIFASLASADVLRRLAPDLEVVFIPAKRALRPRMLLRALRPGVIFASLASADVLRRLAPADAPRRLASTDAPQCNASHRRWHHFLPKAALRQMFYSSLTSSYTLGMFLANN